MYEVRDGSHDRFARATSWLTGVALAGCMSLSAGCADSMIDPELEEAEALADEEAAEEAAGSLALPTVLASGQEFPADVEVDANDAYWINAVNFGLDPGLIRRTGKAGGGPVVDVEVGIQDIGAIRLDAERVYWAAGAAEEGVGGLWSRTKAGGPVVDLLADTRVFNFVLDGGSVVLASPDAGGRIAALPKSGGPVTVLADDLGPGLDNIPVVAVAGGRVFFSQSTFGTDCDGRVRFVPRSGGAAVTVADELCGLKGIEADNRSVFWTEFDSTAGVGRVVRLDAPFTGAPVVLATMLEPPLFLALDSSTVYFSAGGPEDVGKIRAVQKRGGGRRLLATDQTFPASIAIDKAHVYWTTILEGEVKRVPK
jgi:hypothetical protein